MANGASQSISRNIAKPTVRRPSASEEDDRKQGAHNASLCSGIRTGVKAQLPLFVRAPGEEEAVRGEGSGMRISRRQLSYRHGPQGLQEDGDRAVCSVC